MSKKLILGEGEKCMVVRMNSNLRLYQLKIIIYIGICRYIFGIYEPYANHKQKPRIGTHTHTHKGERI